MADLFDSVGGAIGSLGKSIGQGLGALNPSNIRKSIAGFGSLGKKKGGAKGETSLTGAKPTRATGDSEWRVTLRDDDAQLVGGGGVLGPLEKTYNGVLFPYTPQINMSYRANYEMVQGVQTNYSIPTYTSSDLDTISVRANFTANNQTEASYLLAVMHFLRSATKSHMGTDPLAGTPPPILYLYGYGEGMFNKAPVIIQSFSFSLPADVDYIATGAPVNDKTAKVAQSLGISATGDQAQMLAEQEAGFDDPKAAAAAPGPADLPRVEITGNRLKGFGSTRVPTNIDIELSLKVIYKRSDLKTLSTESYYSGELVKKGWL